MDEANLSEANTCKLLQSLENFPFDYFKERKKPNCYITLDWSFSHLGVRQKVSLLLSNSSTLYDLLMHTVNTTNSHF